MIERHRQGARERARSNEAGPDPDKAGGGTIMSDVGYHLVLRLGDGRVLATNAEQRRILTATIARVGRPRGVVA
jgi:hypothetical protein